MNRFWALLRLNFKSMLAAFSLGNRKKKALSGWGALLFLAALGLYMSSVYSFSLASALAAGGALALLPAMMSVLACMMGLLLTATAGGGILFGGRDADFMLALPVSAFEVMLSKILALYLENAVFSFFIMAPMGVAYLVSGGTGGVGFALRLLLATFFLPLLATTLGVILGFLLTLLSSRMRRKALVQNILYLVFFAGVMVGSMRINTLFQALQSNPQSVAAAFSRGVLAPFGLFARAVTGGPGAMLAFLGACALPFLLVVWLFSLRYKKILTRANTSAMRSDYHLGRVGVSSPLAALLRMEARRYFGTPSYLLNTSFGSLMLLLATGFACFKTGEVRAALAMIPGGTLPLVCAAVCLMASTICTTSVSLSLEGRSLWILKESPVRTSDIFSAKILFNLMVALPIPAVCAVVLCALLGVGAGGTLLVLLLLCAVCGFISVYGMAVNLHFPKLDWENETIVVKQSASAMLGVFGGMILTAVLALVYLFLLMDKMSFAAFGLLAAALLLAGALLLLRFLATRGKQIFWELN